MTDEWNLLRLPMPLLVIGRSAPIYNCERSSNPVGSSPYLQYSMYNMDMSDESPVTNHSFLEVNNTHANNSRDL